MFDNSFSRMKAILVLAAVIVTSCAPATPNAVQPTATFQILPTQVPTIEPTPLPAPATSLPAPTQASPTQLQPTRVLATLAPTQAPAPPQPKNPPQALSYVDQNLGIAFMYPPEWENLPRASDAPAGVTLRGPIVGEGPEPIIFAMLVEMGPANEKSVKDVLDKQVAALPENVRGGVQRTSLTLGGEAAEQVTGLPSRSGDIETFVLHNSTLYDILLEPYDVNNPSLKPYLDQVRAAYKVVLSSFRFLK